LIAPRRNLNIAGNIPVVKPKTMRKLQTSILFIALFFSYSLVLAQEKKPLQLEDYAQWNRIRQVNLSPDGAWMTYAYEPNDGDATFFVRKVDGDTIRSAMNGKRAAFAPNSEWLAYLTDPAKKEAEKLRKQKKPVKSSLHLMNIPANALNTYEDVKAYSFAETSKFIAIHKNATDRKAEHKGSDLVLKDMTGGPTLNIGNVSAYAFNEPGNLLAYTVDAKDKSGNGIYVIDLGNLRTWPLHTEEALYSQLSWNEKGDQLAILYGVTAEGNVERDNNLLWAWGLASGMTTGASMQTYWPDDDGTFPPNSVISEYRRLNWTDAGDQLFFGIKAQHVKVKKEDELKANVDVWHWKDEQVQSRQEVTANRDKRATHLSVLNLENKMFLQLANDDMTNVQMSEKSYWALGSDDTAYRNDVTRPGGTADLYAIDTRSGRKGVIAREVTWNMRMSANGQWMAYAKNGEVFAFQFGKSDRVNLSVRAGVDFENKEYDVPREKPSYGLAGWSKDGNHILLNQKFDVWAIGLNEDKAVNLTQGMGADGDIRFRLVQLDREADAYDLSETQMLSAYGEWTKKSGYYSVKLGKKPKKLMFEDKSVGRPLKAKNADKVIFTQQTFVDFPDYYAADLSFKKPQRMTEANPQQSEYAWGRRVLIDYTDERGHKLQATMALPAGYEEGKKYPMLVYFYEKMSQRHHVYSYPGYDDRPHMSTYASNGYLVLMPDIIYDEGLPGSSALDDVTSAVKEVIKQGYADPENIGIQGHSWGGYESSFIVTQTDMFKAVVTGAPLTNLISMYNVAYKRSGNLNGPILEWSQGRMGVSPWDNMELYRSQSPIHQAENIKTPFMILHGTADGAVDWVQGLEFYSTARRLGKEVILLSYPGEPHHLRKLDNQKDFQIRMKQYFDHYLKGAPAPLWMKEGVPHLDKKKVGPEVMEKDK